jgi:5'-nucleotidase
MIKRYSVSILAALALAVLSACATGRKGGEGPGPDVVSESGDLETLVLVGTNDLHGNLAPQDLKTRDAAATEYETGGVAYLASYILTLRSQYGEHLLWLDAGDEFQGTLDSNLEHGAPMVDFFNSAGLNAAAIGNHEFDYGAEPPRFPDKRGALRARMTQAKYPYLAANIASRAGGPVPPEEFPNTHSRAIFTAGRLRVGVIGLSTRDTPTTTRSTFVDDLLFTDMREATLREAAALRSEGVQLVLITTHAGVFCSAGGAPAGHVLRKAADPQGECEKDAEISRLLESLPPGTVDAVVSGHTHSIVHHWIAGVPVVQGMFGGRYFNIIYLTYDWKQGKLVADRTRIEGPIPVCPRVFQNQGDCNGERPAPAGRGRGPLVAPRFHGEPIAADADVQAILAPVFARTEGKKKELVATAARPIEHDRHSESELGDLVADAVRLSVGADVAFVNPGGIRAALEQGPITYGAVFRCLPFDNSVSTLDVSGRELRDILRVAESGARGYFPVSGLRLRIDVSDAAPAQDLNANGRIEPWEIDRLLDARLSDGTPIRDDQHYKLATIDFLVTGGDNLGWAMGRISKDRITLAAGPVLRDAVVDHLHKLSAQGPINSVERPLVDPANPRLVFVKPAKKSKKPRRGHKRRARAS